MQYLKTKKNFSRSTPPKQGENLLPYYHRLHVARMVADLPGRAFCKSEARRVREKILFEEALA